MDLKTSECRERKSRCTLNATLESSDSKIMLPSSNHGSPRCFLGTVFVALVIKGANERESRRSSPSDDGG